MIKKLLSIIIIISMMLHCSSRLGVISFLYKNRFDISESLGFSEKHITSCDSHYFSQADLKITDGDTKADMPINISQAQEIILFHSFALPIKFDVPPGSAIDRNFPVCVNMQETYTAAIFHPPLS